PAGDAQVGHSEPDAVGQVQEEHHHGEDVEDRDPPAGEAGDEVRVDLTVLERVRGRRCDAHGQVEDVEDHEQQQDEAGDQHRAAGEGIEATHQVRAGELAARRAGTAAQGECAVDVQNQG